MKQFSPQLGKTLWCAALALVVALLVGSAHSEKAPDRPSDRERVALDLADQLVETDRAAWEEAARRNPLWLIQLTVP